MKKFDCILADDEKLARDVLENYIARIDYLNLVASCRDGMEVNAILLRREVDILFLDIRMPHINGLKLIKALPKMPRIILTTASKEHAIEAFELNVIDYLLKPFSFERFLQAVNKATQENIPPDLSEGKCIHVKVERDLVVVPIKEIVYIEAAGNYVKIHLDGKVLISYASISDLNKMLPEDKFRQIHRSYLVNFHKVLKYTASSVEIKGNTLPIGRNYKSMVSSYFKQIRSAK